MAGGPSHGSGHSHGSPSRSQAGGSAAAQHKTRLKWALVLTASFMVVEVIGGLLTGSLALIADAAHMLTDAGGLALALIAINFGERPATPQKTFGYVRMEVLSALTNAVVLLVVTTFVLYEAYDRFLNPPQVLAGPMMAVAIAGLIVNLISMKLLSAGSSDSLNVKGAYFEVMSDMLGSLGVGVARRPDRRRRHSPHRMDARRSLGRRRYRPLHHPAHMDAPARGDPHPDGGYAAPRRSDVAGKDAARHSRRDGGP
jgi:Co/Zn/Cd efflux system component